MLLSGEAWLGLSFVRIAEFDLAVFYVFFNVLTMEPPNGFRLFNEESKYQISYRSKGMGFMVFFVCSISVILGVTFTSGLFFDTPENFFGADADYIKSRSWFPVGIVLFYAAVLVGVVMSLSKLLTVTTYEISPQNLIVNRRFLFFSNTQTIPSLQIQKLSQIKDGGHGEDSFPSWGLNLYAGRQIKLLRRETIDKSDWLGAELASYYGVEFELSESRE